MCIFNYSNGILGIPVHNSNLNIMAGQMQQMPIRTHSNSEQQKQSLNMQHNNYGVMNNLNFLILLCLYYSLKFEFSNECRGKPTL